MTLRLLILMAMMLFTAPFLVAHAQDEEVEVWLEQEVIKPNSQPPSFLLFSADKQLLIVASRTRWFDRADGRIKLANNVTTVIDTATRKVQKRLGTLGEALLAITFLPSGRLAEVYNDKQGHQKYVEWDRQMWTAAVHGTLYDPRKPPSGIDTLDRRAAASEFGAFSQDGRRFVSHYGHIEGEVIPPLIYSGTTVIWETATWAPLTGWKRDPGADTPRLFFSGDGRLLSDSAREFRDRQDEVRYSNVERITQMMMPVYEIGPPSVRRGTIDMWGPHRSQALSPDGRWLAACVVDNQAGSLLVYDIQGGRKEEPVTRALDATPRISRDRLYSALAFSPDGQWLAAGYTDGTVRVWDARTWQSVQEMSGGKKEVDVITFSPDSRSLAVGTHDGRIRIWSHQP